MIRILRMLGFRLHRWEYTDRHRCIRCCKDCGEEQQMFMLWVSGPSVSWWETTNSGNGSCGTKELPTRVY